MSEKQTVAEIETQLGKVRDALDVARAPLSHTPGSSAKQRQKATAKQQARRAELIAEEKSLVRALAAAQGVDNCDRIGEDLRRAVVRDDLDRVSRICSEHGSLIMDSTNFENSTALIKAAMYDRSNMVNLLVAAGASVEHADDQGRTALMLAAAHGFVASTQSLLDVGASMGTVDSRGWNAFMHAAADGHRECCELLLATGGPALCLETRSFLGFTALELVSASHEKAVASRQAVLDESEHALALDRIVTSSAEVIALLTEAMSVGMPVADLCPAPPAVRTPSRTSSRSFRSKGASRFKASDGASFIQRMRGIVAPSAPSVPPSVLQPSSVPCLANLSKDQACNANGDGHVIARSVTPVLNEALSSDRLRTDPLDAVHPLATNQLRPNPPGLALNANVANQRASHASNIASRRLARWNVSSASQRPGVTTPHDNDGGEEDAKIPASLTDSFVQKAHVAETSFLRRVGGLRQRMAGHLSGLFVSKERTAAKTVLSSLPAGDIVVPRVV